MVLRQHLLIFHLRAEGLDNRVELNVVFLQLVLRRNHRHLLFLALLNIEVEEFRLLLELLERGFLAAALLEPVQHALHSVIIGDLVLVPIHFANAEVITLRALIVVPIVLVCKAARALADAFLGFVVRVELRGGAKETLPLLVAQLLKVFKALSELVVGGVAVEGRHAVHHKVLHGALALLNLRRQVGIRNLASETRL